MQPAISALVAELGLPAFAQSSDGDVILERMSREAPHRYRGAGGVAESLRLAGGTAALVGALVRDLPRERLHLGARVTTMALADGGVEMTFSRADGAIETVIAQCAIAAAPPRLLEATMTFTPGPEPATARLWRGTATWMAPHAKFFAVYERTFWREAGLSGTARSMVGPMAEVHDATTASGNAALFGFLGIDAAIRAALGEEALTQACLTQLDRLFGPQALRPRATLLKDWAADPLTAMLADKTTGGHPVPSDAQWTSGPWRERLALAGSETSPSEPGYLAGAVVASERAVQQMVAMLR